MKIPDPSAAKKMTLAGQKRLAEEEALRSKLAAEEEERQKRLEKNWKTQSKKFAEAAISQNDHIEVSSVTFPSKLIEVGFEIEEIGDISRHYYEDLPRARIIEDLKDLIPTFSSHAPESALRIWRYWEDVDEELRGEIESFLNKPKSKYEPGDLRDHLSRNADFKRLHLPRFESILDEIQAAAEKVKTVMLISNWKRFEFGEVDNLLSQASDGKYFFSSSDLFDAELSPLAPENKFRIAWASGTYSHFNKPRQVISANGLAWLTGDDGQRLCEAIGTRIQQSAEKGLASLKLGFEAEILKDDDGYIGTCPSEDFLVELISLLGYVCKTKNEPECITSFNITW